MLMLGNTLWSICKQVLLKQFILPCGKQNFWVYLPETTVTSAPCFPFISSAPFLHLQNAHSLHNTMTLSLCLLISKSSGVSDARVSSKIQVFHLVSQKQGSLLNWQARKEHVSAELPFFDFLQNCIINLIFWGFLPTKYC